MPRFRPRISLLTALLLTTIVGLTIVVALFRREIGPLRAEVRSLRNETGQLMVDSGDLVYVVALRPVVSRETNVWRWRVYLPPGRNYKAHAFVRMGRGRQQLEERMADDVEFLLEPGEHILRVELHKKLDAAWTLQYSYEPAGISDQYQIPQTRAITLPWRVQSPGYLLGYGFLGELGDRQQHFAADATVELLRLYPNYMLDPDYMLDDPTRLNSENNKHLRESTKPPTQAFYFWINSTSVTGPK